jgi:hypothetical protein
VSTSLPPKMFFRLKRHMVRVTLHSSLNNCNNDTGTQFLYIRVPELGPEAHPFSLAAMCPSFVIKCNGDWTQRLHDLAVKQATESLIADAAKKGSVLHPDGISLDQLTKVTTKIICEVDGVYGNASPPWRSFSHVLYVSDP